MEPIFTEARRLVLRICVLALGRHHAADFKIDSAAALDDIRTTVAGLTEADLSVNNQHTVTRP